MGLCVVLTKKNQNNMKSLFSFLAFLFLSLPIFSQAKPFNYENEKRRYMIYLPHAYHTKTDQNFPVVFNFHGGGMTMTEHMFYTGMNETAEKNKFIVVYPQGVKEDWNVGFEMSYTNGTNDVGFVDSLLTHLVEKFRIDENRVYATGLSRGGFFTHRLAAELPERFAAIASIGAPIPDSVAIFHKHKIPVSVMTIHGTADSIVKYNGKENAYFSAEETYHYWNEVNRIENAPEKIKIIDNLKKDSTSIQIRTKSYNGFISTLVTIENGGHTWPGRHPFNIGFPLGLTTQEIDVNELVWKFFSKQTLKN